MILVKIYFYFAANSFWRKRETLTSYAETKSKGDRVVICLQGKNYWKSLVQAQALHFVFRKWAWSTEINKVSEWTIDFRCNKNNLSRVVGDRSDCQPLATTIACPQPRALSTGHHFYNSKWSKVWQCLRLRTIELALGWQSDLSPSTQGIIFIIVNEAKSDNVCWWGVHWLRTDAIIGLQSWSMATVPRIERQRKHFGMKQNRAGLTRIELFYTEFIPTI